MSAKKSLQEKRCQETDEGEVEQNPFVGSEIAIPASYEFNALWFRVVLFFSKVFSVSLRGFDNQIFYTHMGSCSV